MEQDKTEKLCIYCENATPMFDGENVLCVHCGIVPCDSHCRKFSYDPLKRVPPKSAPAPVLDYIDIDSKDE